MEIREIYFQTHRLEKLSKTRSLFYGKFNINSVKLTSLLIKKLLTKELISRKFLSLIAMYVQCLTSSPANFA